jgi:hypothetical protein
MGELVGFLTLAGLGDVAQAGIAVTGALAFLGAAWQISISRASAKRARVYEYADRFNQPEIIRASAHFAEYWKDHSYAGYKELELAKQMEWRMLPNIIEEVAYLYNRRLLDRNVAAELLGIYIERLWTVGKPLTDGLREERRPDIYTEWEEMQEDTPRRQIKGFRKAKRRRARHRFFRRLFKRPS